MMKKILLMVICVFSYTAHAQFGPEQTISEIGGAEVYTFDLDGDEDLDILIAGTYQTSWFENIDGLGDYGPQQIITNQLGMASTYASDLDGDGDLDILVVLGEFLKPVFVTSLVWFENLDGQGNFGDKQIIEDENTFPLLSRTVYSTDLDGDGDMDVLTGSHGELFWYQNLDGFGNFSELQLINPQIALVKEVYAGDLDGDGDMDVLVSSVQDNSIAWYENTDGLGNFGTENIIADNIGEAWSIYISDLNGDGDNDVLAAYWDTEELSWFENTDGLGTFGEQQVISNNTQRGYKVYVEDMDGDGNLDVLFASYESPIGTFAWYRNMDGQGNFGDQQIIHQGEHFASSLFAGDIDNDTDIDVVVGSATSGVAWFENLQELSIEDNNLLKISIHPNPTEDFLKIENGQNIISINIYDVSGRLLLQENQNFKSIDVSNLSRGLLLVKINSMDGFFSYKIIKK